MTIILDLPTILFVLQASYVAGALALAYARFRSTEAAGAELIALGFLVLAAGAMLASMAEEDQAHYAALSLANITMAMLAYPLFVAGAVELSRRKPLRPLWLVLVPPVVTVCLGLATEFQTVNWLRAALFNSVASVSLLTAAVVFLRDSRKEPLPARRIVVAAFAAAGTVSLIMATEFLTGRFWPAPAMSFVVILALKFAIALSVMILAMERAITRLDRLAHTDALTGLSNRRLFFDAVPARLSPGDAVVIFDADRFKKLNDTWGHVVGDEVLQAMANALSSHVRPEDVLARYGGEEFVLYLPEVGEVRALAIADSMRAEVSGITLVGTPVNVTISAGVGVATVEGTPLDQLISLADEALYDSKAAGGNACRLGRPSDPVDPPETGTKQTSAA